MHEALARANFDQDVASLTDATAARQNLIVNERAYPFLDVTIQYRMPLRLKLEAIGWDEVPPSIAPLSSDGNFWPPPFPGGGVFNASAHPHTGRAFVCMRGSREFHTHFSHVNERWDNYRGQEGMGLVGIVMQLSHAWRGLHP